jgi:hypothetical protein
MRNRILLLITVFIITSFGTDNNVEGLVVIFRKVSEDYLRSGEPNGIMSVAPILADEGMKFVKVKLTLKNEGEKECVFDFADVYISTEQDSLYRFIKLQGLFTGTKTKIKPHKEVDRTVLFDFPDKAKPKELFIEDKRFIIIEKE